MNLIKSLPITSDMVSLWIPSGTSGVIDVIRGNHGQSSGTHPNVLVNTGLIDPSVGWVFGGDDYVNCGNDKSLQFGTGDFGVGFWVNIDDYTGQVISHYGVDGKGYQIRFSNSANTGKGIYTKIADGTNVYEARKDSLSEYSYSSWNYMEVVFDRDVGTLIYLNDVLITGLTETGTMASVGSINTTGNLLFGQVVDQQYFSGHFALPFIANKVRSIAERKNFRLHTKGLFAPRG